MASNWLNADLGKILMLSSNQSDIFNPVNTKNSAYGNEGKNLGIKRSKF